MTARSRKADKATAEELNALFCLFLDPMLADDPYAFVMAAFPWGKEGTPLYGFSGPRTWQKEVLLDIRNQVIDNRNRLSLGIEPLPLRLAVCSGRGIGKTTLESWIAWWHITCHIGSSTYVSANNEAQLTNVFWGELKKWYALGLFKSLFNVSATSIFPTTDYARLVESQLAIGTSYYYIQQRLWSEENPDAYAGLHNPLGMLIMFDEASGIPKSIWEVGDGFFTEPALHRYHLAFSNGRRNSGAFFECFHANRDFWKTRTIDSRTVEGTDKGLFARQIEQYGEDSDFVRVEIKGLFPHQGDNQFISRKVVQEAMVREVEDDAQAPLYMGVDVARYGSDASTIQFRRGRNARNAAPSFEFRKMDNMQLAYKCAEVIDQYRPDAVCIDAGAGSGVIDRLRDMGYTVFEIPFGGAPEDKAYLNVRAEIWGRMRDAMPFMAIENDPRLFDDLTAPEYSYAKNGDALQLESKESMKKRGVHSPDKGDALALTFAVRVRGAGYQGGSLHGGKIKVQMGHDSKRRRR